MLSSKVNYEINRLFKRVIEILCVKVCLSYLRKIILTQLSCLLLMLLCAFFLYLLANISKHSLKLKNNVVKGDEGVHVKFAVSCI